MAPPPAVQFLYKSRADVLHSAPMSSRRTLDSEDAAYEAAIKLLARKARTSSEVRQELLSRGATDDMAEAVVARLKSQRHVDDAVLAADEAFKVIEGKGLAPDLAVHHLVQRGLIEHMAREAVSTVSEGRTTLELCRAALARRLKGRRLGLAGVPKEGRALARLGYDEDVITRALEGATTGDEG